MRKGSPRVWSAESSLSSTLLKNSGIRFIIRRVRGRQSRSHRNADAFRLLPEGQALLRDPRCQDLTSYERVCHPCARSRLSSSGASPTDQFANCKVNIGDDILGARPSPASPGPLLASVLFSCFQLYPQQAGVSGMRTIESKVHSTCTDGRTSFAFGVALLFWEYRQMIDHLY